MRNPDEINADKVAEKKAEADRIEFLRRCVISFAGSGKMLGNVLNTDSPGTQMTAETAAKLIVQDWVDLFDAIEATRKP